MNTPWFNHDRKADTTSSRASARKSPKWIQVSHIDGQMLSDSRDSGQKRIFAIVTMPFVLHGKSVQRVLIFDNHPDSLRLAAEQYLNPDADSAASRHTSRSYIIFGLVLILTLVFGMIWPLL
jgi:hypothetical protein